MLLIPEKKEMSGDEFSFIRFGSWKYPTAVARRIFSGKFHQSMHYHDFSQIWYCHEGEYIHQLDGNSYHCGKGSLIVVPPGVWHGFEIPEGCEADIFCIDVKCSLFADIQQGKYLNAVANLMLPCFAKELGHSFPEVCQLGPKSQALITDYLSNLSILDVKSSDMEVEYIHEHLELLFSLPELAIPEKLHRKALRLAEQKVKPLVRTIIYLNENYAQKIVAEDLLKVAAMCHTDFYKSFRRFTGMTFSDYLVQLRIARVWIFLRDTTYSLTRIAELCGFGDAAHMSKCFKKHTGMLLKDVRSSVISRRENTQGMGPRRI